MPRRNEYSSMIRQEPFAYVAEYTDNLMTYEAWAMPGTDITSATWIACKHTYDSNGNITRTQWAQSATLSIADFAVAANNLSGLTYV